MKLPSLSENGTEKYPNFEIPKVRVGTKTADRIRVSYSANNPHTPTPLDKTEVGVDEDKATDTHDGWWYSDESNSHDQNNYPNWDNKSEDNRYAFVGAVAIQYQPGMTITYGADDTAWGSHWACTQTQVVSTLNERVIIYDHIKDSIIPVDQKHPGKPGEPIDPKDPDPKRTVWPEGTDKDSLSKDVTEHITYTGLPATETPAEVKHVLHFTGSCYLDKVTGKWTDKDGNELEDQSLDKALEWTAQEGNDFDAVASPNKAGYYVDRVDVKVGDQQLDKDTDEYSAYTDGKDVKAVENITHNHENIVITVIYAPYQKAGLTIIDEGDIRAAEPNGHKLGSYSDTGKSGKDIAFTGAQAAVDAYLKAGYIWDSAKTKATDGTKADNYEGLKLGKLDKDASKDQNWTIYLKHGKVTVTPKNPGKPGEPINPNGPKWPAGTDANSLTKTGTQTIHYLGAGDKTPADNTQTYTFIKSMVIDKVTGKVLDLGSWNIDSYTFGTVKTPVIPGYHADKDVAGGETVTPDDLNKVITVTYIPDGNPDNPGDQGDTPTPESTPEPEPTPNPTPDDQPDSEISSDEHFKNVKAKDKLDKTNPKKVDAYKKQRKIIKTKIAKQGHTEIAEPIEDKVTRENNVKVVSDPVENKAAEPKLPQTGEADNSIIGLLGMLLASFAAMFGFDSLHSHDKKHQN